MEDKIQIPNYLIKDCADYVKRASRVAVMRFTKEASGGIDLDDPYLDEMMFTLRYANMLYMNLQNAINNNSEYVVSNNEARVYNILVDVYFFAVIRLNESIDNLKWVQNIMECRKICAIADECF